MFSTGEYLPEQVELLAGQVVLDGWLPPYKVGPPDYFWALVFLMASDVFYDLGLKNIDVFQVTPPYLEKQVQPRIFFP